MNIPGISRSKVKEWWTGPLRSALKSSQVSPASTYKSGWQTQSNVIKVSSICKVPWIFITPHQTYHFLWLFLFWSMFDIWKIPVETDETTVGAVIPSVHQSPNPGSVSVCIMQSVELHYAIQENSLLFLLLSSLHSSSIPSLFVCPPSRSLSLSLSLSVFPSLQAVDIGWATLVLLNLLHLILTSLSENKTPADGSYICTLE